MAGVEDLYGRYINKAIAVLFRMLLRQTSNSQLPAGFSLPSGSVVFLTFTGVPDAEISFARTNSTQTLVEHMSAAGAYPFTDPSRVSIF
jgi:hypothetical protein